MKPENIPVPQCCAPVPWEEGEKIPWHEPGFSQRMLACHLDQNHDWASRRFALIDQQVAWINRKFGGRTLRILDLACGPGFYTQRLARLGHACVGVDFSPASIEYARAQARLAALQIRYELADVRGFQPEGRFDLVMMTFGEFNVFRESDASDMLERAASHLKPRGHVLIEASTWDAVKADALRREDCKQHPHGVFSDSPYACREEHFWDEFSAVASTRYTITDSQSGEAVKYASSSKAYTDADYARLFEDAGLHTPELISEDDWPVGEPFVGKLRVMTASLR